MKANIEKYILNTMLISPSHCIDLIDLGVDKYVEHPIIKPIVSFISSYYRQHKKIPPADLIVENFPQQKYFLSEIVNLEPAPDWAVSEVEKFVKTVKVQKLTEFILTNSSNPKITPEELWEKGREILRLRTPSRLGVDYFSEIPRPYYEKFHPESLENIIPTGLVKLDELMYGGMRKGWFGFVMGGTGMGKSALLINFTANALLFNKKVLYISLEMSVDEVMLRIDAKLTGKTMEELSNPSMDNYLRQFLSMVKQKYTEANLRLIYFPSKSISVNKIPSIIESFQMINFKPDLLVIDFADYFAPLSKRNSAWEEVVDTFQVLPGFAKEYDMAIWTATEIGKAKMYNEQATIDTMYGGSGKSFGADIILGISATKEEARLGGLRLTVSKFRHGRSLIDIPVFFDRARMLIKTL